MNKIKSLFSLFLFLTLFAVIPQTANAEEFNSGPTGSHIFRALPSAKNTEVTLVWQDDDRANNYNIVYGFAPNQYQFGLAGLGDTNTATIGELNPGTTYFFSLIAEKHVEVGEEGEEKEVVTEEVEQSSPIKFIAGSKSAIPVASAGTSGPVGSYGLQAQPGDNPGEIKLNWNTKDSVNGYDIVYSVVPGQNYLFGVQDIGNVNSYTIKSLESGKPYYFALLPEINGEGGMFTEQVMAKAK